MSKKSPHATDVSVGARIKMRRREIGMSQSDLGDAIGLTFQQVQKYEKGSNRVGGSRLVQIAEVLSVPAAWFFGHESVPSDEMVLLDQFMASEDAMRLSRSFVRLPKTTQRAVVAMVEQIAEGETLQ